MKRNKAIKQELKSYPKKKVQIVNFNWNVK